MAKRERCWNRRGFSEVGILIGVFMVAVGLLMIYGAGLVFPPLCVANPSLGEYCASYATDLIFTLFGFAFVIFGAGIAVFL